MSLGCDCGCMIWVGEWCEAEENNCIQESASNDDKTDGKKNIKSEWEKTMDGP